MEKNFPEHWVETTLDSICTIDTGKWDANHAALDGKYRFYTCAIEHQYCHTNRFSGECIILPGNGANVGEVFYYFGEFDAYQRTYVLSNFKINTRYSFYHLLLNWKKLNQYKQYGSATNFIRISNFKEYIIPLPPLNEQKRIVEKLDAILPKVKSAKARLEKIPVILKKFRQSVLAAACSGRLTEDWREEYTQRTGKELPEWDEKKLNEIAQINPKNKIDDELEVSFIPMAFISSMFNKNPEFEVKNWKEIKKGFNHFKDNDVIVAKITPCFENSKAGIVRNLKNGYGAGTTEIYVLRCYDFILPEYLYYIIKTNDFIESGKSLMTGTAGQQRIPRYFIENFEINLPPLEEQQEIVRRVEKLFALADSLEAKYKKALERVEKLEQAILAKAFRGELVEPDPNDEPAEELLKRILEEKAKIEGGKKTRKPRTRKK